MSATITPPSTQTTADRTAVWGPIVVSMLVLLIFLAAIVVAWWTKDVSLQILLGMAGANAGTAVGYWLGSSSGSKTKDATIAQIGAAVTTTPTP